MMAKIRDEGLNRSQGKEILWWISDVFGPRLTGSQERYAAALWAKNKFTEMGLENSHLESWGPFGKSWRLKEYSATMIGRQIQSERRNSHDRRSFGFVAWRSRRNG